DDAAAVLAELAGSLAAVPVRFDQTRCEAAWHRSLYLAAVPDPALRRIAERAVRTFAVSEPAPFEPHLSLPYSELPVADKLRLAARRGRAAHRHRPQAGGVSRQRRPHAGDRSGRPHVADGRHRPLRTDREHAVFRPQ